MRKKFIWTDQKLSAFKFMLKRKVKLKTIAETVGCPLAAAYLKVFELTGKSTNELYERGQGKSSTSYSKRLLKNQNPSHKELIDAWPNRNHSINSGPLSQSEKEILKTLVLENKTNKEIAKIMNRTIDSIKHHRSILLPSTPSNITHWTKEEIIKLKTLTQEGKTNGQIAIALQRSISSIESKKRDLKEQGDWNVEVEFKPRSEGDTHLTQLFAHYKDLGFKKVTIILE